MAEMQTTKKAVAVAVQCGLTPLIWGVPGIGKTQFSYALGRVLNKKVYTIISALREPQDFQGLPMPKEELLNGKTIRVASFIPPAWIKRIAYEGNALIFLDEIDKARREVQNALLRLVLERRLNIDDEEIFLPDSVAFVAAANPPDKGGDWELSPPLANRFMHLMMKADVDTFFKGMVYGDWGDDELPQVPPDWEAYLPAQKVLIATFIKRNPSLLEAFPENPEQQGRAWPSPRTWEMAAKYLAACEATKTEDEVKVVGVEGLVGEGAALAFFNFVKKLDLPDPLDVLLDPTLLPTHPDSLFVILAAIPTIIRDEQEWLLGFELLRRVEQDKGVDYALVLFKGLAEVGKAKGFNKEKAVPILKGLRVVEVMLL